MVGVNQRVAFVGALAVTVAATVSSLYWDVTGVVAAGFVGGSVAGFGTDDWSDTTLNGIVAGALGGVFFLGGLAVLALLLPSSAGSRPDRWTSRST